MKRITLELPDYVENTNILVFSNFEYVARKMVNRKWEVKTVRCNHCGRCCHNLDEGNKRKGILPITPEGHCANLEKRKDGGWWCAYHIPIYCLTSNPSADKNCPVEWETVETD